MTKTMNRILYLFILSILGFTLWYEYQVNSANRLTETKTIIIEQGLGSREIAKNLEDQGVINNNLVFLLASKLSYSGKKIKSGEYDFEPAQSINNILTKLTRGEVKIRKLTIPEGLSAAHIIKLINQDPHLQGDLGESIILGCSEGSIFPDTYFYTYGETRAKLLKRAQEKMTLSLNSMKSELPESGIINDVNKLLILASIVEKEAKFDDEKPIIASVFLNRLKIGMPLQSDPTALYEVTKKGSVELGRMPTRADMKIDSPYNTYKVKGLTPTPICSPGLKSLEAVLKPAKTDFLYFVTDGASGRHSFSASYEKHREFVKKKDTPSQASTPPQ